MRDQTLRTANTGQSAVLPSRLCFLLLLFLVVCLTSGRCASEPLQLIPAGFKGQVETTHIADELIDEYMVRTWDINSGLPANHVDAVARDRDGYLWCTTWTGLSRFNGNEFINFNPNNTPSLREETFSCVLVDHHNDLWASSKDGLYRVRGTTFEYFGTNCGIPSPDILSMELDSAGHIWLCTTEGLARFDGTNAIAYHHGEPQTSTQGIQFLNNGKAIVFLSPPAGKRAYAVSFDPATGEFGALSKVFNLNPEELHRTILGPDGEGSIWFRTEHAIYRQKTDGQTELMRKITEDLKNERLLLLCDSRGDVWMAGKKAGVLERYSHGSIATIDLGTRARIASFDSMKEEDDGLYWVCTGQGLVQLKERAVKTYGRRQGLLHDYIFSVADFGDNRILVGTYRWPAILDLTRKEMEAFILGSPSTNFSSVNETSRSLIPATANSFWVTDGDFGPTLVSMAGDVHRTSLSTHWPYRSDQYCFYRDSAQRIWIGCATNLYYFHGQQVECITDGDIPGLVPDQVRVVREMRDHAIWLGRKGGGITVLSADGRQVLKHYSTKNGLSNNDVWTIEPDDDDNVWVGTGNGLNRISHERCQSVRPPDGPLAEGDINHILRDNYGYLWLTSNQGIFRVDPTEVANYLEGKADSFAITSVTRDDGLMSAETNGEQQPAGFVSSDGRLCIPTISGLAIVDPSRFRSEIKPAPPLIERVVIDGKVYYDNGPGLQGKNSLKQTLSVPPGGGQLVEIHFAAPQARTRGQVTYEIRLAGHENDWRSIGSQDTAIYTTLRPGDYALDLRVSDHNLRTSDVVTGFRFHIAAFPYQTTPFWVVMGGLIIAGAFRLHRRRLTVAGRIQKLEQKTALVAERERIARDMHDDLGSRLTHISLLADLTKRIQSEKKEMKLGELSLAARDAARSVEEIVWAANPGNDTLASLMNYMIQHAENVLGSADIRCRVDAASEWPECYLSPDARHSAFMAFKEALNNLLKHAQASEVCLFLHPEDDQIIIRVTDNGKGFDQTAGRQDEQDGLINMNNRMAKVAGHCRIESKPAAGTTVEFIFPWRNKRN